MLLSRFAGTRGYWLGVLAAVVVALPTLGFGFFVDDYLMFSAIEGHSPISSSFDLFAFGAGDAAHAMTLIEDGPYPWFGDPEFKAHFFRPLASALMTFDHALFGQFSPAYNAHSIAWYGLLCLAVMLILRRTLSSTVGVLALFMFVVTLSHVLPVAWWSNRHSVIAVGFGFLGVAAHLRWREEGWRPGLPLSVAAYIMALLAAETGLGTLGYVLAYELFGARDTARHRLVCVLPSALVAIGYVVFYRWGGYGAQFSDVYIDPTQNPIVFLLVAPARFLMLSGALFFLAPVEAVLLRPALEPLFILVGAIGLSVIAWAVYTLWPEIDARERHTLRWLIPGMALAATPSLAAIVNSRVLLAPSLGGTAVIAVIVLYSWRILRNKASATKVKDFTRPLLALLLCFLVVAHLFIAPLSWPVQVAVLRGVKHHLNGLIRHSELDEARIAESQVVLFNAHDPYTGLYPLMLRHFDRLPVPRSWWTLSLAPYPHRITRVGDMAMELEIVGGQMFTTIIEKLFRGGSRPLHLGQMVDLNGLRVTVLKVGDKGPTRLRLDFAHPLDGDAYQLLVYREGAYRRIEAPPLGETVELPGGFW